MLEVVRVESPADLPAPDESAIDIALLDMNCGYANVGHDAIVAIVRDAVREFEGELAAKGRRARLLSYALRDKLMVPDHASGRHRMYLGTGGPGHLDPRRNTADRGAQEVAENPAWEPQLWELFDAVAADRGAALYGVCHTFGLICRWSGIAEPSLRGPEKGGPMSGIGTNLLTPQALDHPWFARMAECGAGVAVPVLDSRYYDLLPSGNVRAGATPIAYESEGMAAKRGNALTMLEIAREPDGTPRFFAVNSHPEISDATRVGALLESMLASGAIDRAVYEQRSAILPVLRDDRSAERLCVGRVVFSDLVRDRFARLVRALMHPRLRSAFNAAYDDARYDRYARALEAQTGPIGFRLAETPVFFAPDLVARCESAAREIVAQLGEPARMRRMASAVPERFAADDRSALPQFAVVDFAIARSADGTLVPRVVELQGFPSLYAFEVFQRDAWAFEMASTFPGIAWSSWYSGLDRTGYVELLRRTIVGDADPATVVLCDLEPDRQKTACDFVATKALYGIDAIDPRTISKRGNRLFRRDPAGREVRVERLYNRLVGDDLAAVAPSLAFDVRDDLDVTWAPHPRWFWQWSKASMPFLDHAAVPRTRLLSEIDELPADLTRDHVLKPLFSFAGGGVDIHPTRAACDAVPKTEKHVWCLQEKIAYAGALMTPDGQPVKIELRVMFLRPDASDALVAVTNLARLSRGDMHGVDHNKDRTWVGSSIGLWEEGASG